MTQTIFALFLVLATAASAERRLLQSPTLVTLPRTPAPAPAPCPAPKEPGAGCVMGATQFQTDCAAFVGALNSATGGKVVARSDNEITALVQGLMKKGIAPSPVCCNSSIVLLADACICNTAVQAVAKAQQNLTPADFQTVGKVFLAACGAPACTDTCRLPSVAG